MKEIDINSGSSDMLARELSNFAAHSFVFHGESCASMESFLQSLKCRSLVEQRYIRSMSPSDAKAYGKRKWKWWLLKRAYFLNRRYYLRSDKFEELVDAAYDALYLQSKAFRKALLLAGREKAIIRHSIGKTKGKTILSAYHFVRRINDLIARSINENESGAKHEDQT